MGLFKKEAKPKYLEEDYSILYKIKYNNIMELLDKELLVNSMDVKLTRVKFDTGEEFEIVHYNGIVKSVNSKSPFNIVKRLEFSIHDKPSVENVKEYKKVHEIYNDAYSYKEYSLLLGGKNLQKLNKAYSDYSFINLMRIDHLLKNTEYDHFVTSEIVANHGLVERIKHWNFFNLTLEDVEEKINNYFQDIQFNLKELGLDELSLPQATIVVEDDSYTPISEQQTFILESTMKEDNSINNILHNDYYFREDNLLFSLTNLLYENIIVIEGASNLNNIFDGEELPDFEFEDADVIISDHIINNDGNIIEVVPLLEARKSSKELFIEQCEYVDNLNLKVAFSDSFLTTLAFTEEDFKTFNNIVDENVMLENKLSGLDEEIQEFLPLYNTMFDEYDNSTDESKKELLKNSAMVVSTKVNDLNDKRIDVQNTRKEILNDLILLFNTKDIDDVTKQYCFTIINSKMDKINEFLLHDGKIS